MASEQNFPTIRDLRDRLSNLIDRGFGALPVQIVVAPDSSIQALADAEGPHGKPAIMIEFPIEGRLFGISFISTDRLGGGNSMPTVVRQ